MTISTRDDLLWTLGRIGELAERCRAQWPAVEQRVREMRAGYPSVASGGDASTTRTPEGPDADVVLTRVERLAITPDPIAEAHQRAVAHVRQALRRVDAVGLAVDGWGTEVAVDPWLWSARSCLSAIPGTCRWLVAAESTVPGSIAKVGRHGRSLWTSIGHAEADMRAVDGHRRSLLEPHLGADAPAQDDDRWCANHAAYGMNEPRWQVGTKFCQWCHGYRSDHGHAPPKALLEAKARGERITDKLIRQLDPQTRAAN